MCFIVATKRPAQAFAVSVSSYSCTFVTSAKFCITKHFAASSLSALKL